MAAPGPGQHQGRTGAQSISNTCEYCVVPACPRCEARQRPWRQPWRRRTGRRAATFKAGLHAAALPTMALPRIISDSACRPWMEWSPSRPGPPRSSARRAMMPGAKHQASRTKHQVRACPVRVFASLRRSRPTGKPRWWREAPLAASAAQSAVRTACATQLGVASAGARGGWHPCSPSATVPDPLGSAECRVRSTRHEAFATAAAAHELMATDSRTAAFRSHLAAVAVPAAAQKRACTTDCTCPRKPASSLPTPARLFHPSGPLLPTFLACLAAPTYGPAKGPARALPPCLLPDGLPWPAAERPGPSAAEC